MSAIKVGKESAFVIVTNATLAIFLVNFLILYFGYFYVWIPSAILIIIATSLSSKRNPTEPIVLLQSKECYLIIKII